MASPYYTKQPVYIKEPSGRYANILKKGLTSSWDEEEGITQNTPTILNFPFTPTISIIQSANYQEYQLTHLY